MKAAYYNENDKFAAAWLRELINNGLITDGEVDERSIHDVQPQDLRGFTRCHFFAGIGGWDYALQLAGWGDDPVWTGSCPCQPFSAAGKQKGTDDERHLWPEFFRLISQCRPATIFGEQVASKAGLGWLDGVQADLEGEGYAFGAADLCSAGVGAPHIRQRLYWLADAQLGATERWGHDVDAAACRVSEEARQRQRIRSESGDGGADGCGLGEPCCGGWQAGRETATSDGHGGAAESAIGLCSGLANTEHAKSQRQRQHCGQVLPEQKAAGPGPSGTQGVAQGDTDCCELAIGQEQSTRKEQPPPSRAGRDNYELIRCVEPTKEPGRVLEKWRRVEPGTLPLAYGIPGRVGRLRGYGNAIDPEVAEQFIAAYMDIR